MGNPRLLLMCPTLAVSGAERQFATLALGLRSNDFEPVVITLNYEGRLFDELGESGIPVSCAHMRSRYDVVRAIRAIQLGIRFRPQVVVTQSIDAHVVGRAVAAFRRCPHLTIEHGGPGLKTKRHHRFWYRVVAPSTTRTAAVSETQIPQLLTRGYRRDRIDVIPNGIAALKPRRHREAVRSELGLDETNFVPLLIATLRPEKRAADFVEIVVAAHRRRSELRGLIVGGGPELGRVCARAAAEDGVVQVLGERHDVADLILASDVVCLTSSVEGLPVSVLEAMSLGRPVVATNVGGIPSAIESEVTGVLVPPGDHQAFVSALVTLAADRQRAQCMGREAERVFAERFTDEGMTARYVRTIQELLAPTAAA
jgi:glycosyltransferase involved in cell wall biosynthesis